VDRLFLQRPVETLDHAVGLRFGHEGKALVDPPERDLVQEVGGSVLRAVIHAQFQPLGHVFVRRSELALKSLHNRLQGREPSAPHIRFGAGPVSSRRAIRGPPAAHGGRKTRFGPVWLGFTKTFGKIKEKRCSPLAHCRCCEGGKKQSAERGPNDS
jgi:hypothetical protein